MTGPRPTSIWGINERYVSTSLGRQNSFTTGQVYDTVIAQERRGDYLGGTVQVIPHITDEIKRRILNAAKGFDVAICEVGGTVGDIESLPFLEAIRQFRWDWGREHVLYLHLTLVPFISAAGELKTKPTQHSVKELTSMGIQPDVLLCRTDRYLDHKVKAKIAHFCNVDEHAVITAKDVDCIYEVPLVFHQEGLDQCVVDKLNMWTGTPDLSRWEKVVRTFQQPHDQVRIAMIGKYVELIDSYKSLNEALAHGGFANECRVEVDHIDSEQLEAGEFPDALSQADGVLVPMGFGQRGTEGKITAVRYAREGGVPFLGICFGMQMAVIEFSRNVCGLDKANSAEIDPDTPHPVIALMAEQNHVLEKGGTMRLGAYPCTVLDSSLAASVYGKKRISERHRHRYEFNNAYRHQLSQKGLIFSGLSPDQSLVEIVELADHPWFIGVQFHPEFKSRPFDCHPLFRGFIQAARQCRAGYGVQAEYTSSCPSRAKARAGPHPGEGRERMIRECQPNAVPIGPLTCGQGRPFVLMAGPCVIESRDSALHHAQALKTVTDRLRIPLVYKSSYDKANRTSVESFRGPGQDEGLRILAGVKRELEVLILTDVHTPQEVRAAAEVADIVQIPAFLCRQTDLLVAAGQSGRVVNIKKGQFVAPHDIVHAAHKVASTGNRHILLTERGASFGYNYLVSDFRALPIMARSGYPVVYDATHSVQLPGGQGTRSGGQREFIAPLARAAVAVGVDGLFMEVHRNPDQARSDSASVFPLDRLETLLRTLQRLDRLVKA